MNKDKIIKFIKENPVEIRISDEYFNADIKLLSCMSELPLAAEQTIRLGELLFDTLEAAKRSAYLQGFEAGVYFNEDN